MPDSLKVENRKKKQREKKNFHKTEGKKIESSHTSQNIQGTVPIQNTVTSVPANSIASSSVDSFNLFKGHLLKPVSSRDSYHFSNNFAWLSWILILCFALFVFTRTNYRKRITDLINAFLSNRNTAQFIREENALFNRLSVILTSLFIILGSLFFMQVNAYYGFSPTLQSFSIVNYSKVTGALVCFFLLKTLVVKGTGIVFNSGAEVQYHLFINFLFNNILAFFLFPLTIIIQFVSFIPKPVLVSFSIYFIAAYSAFRLFRLFNAGVSQLRVGIFYLFLYLCTFEILPLIVLIKILVS